MKKFFAILSAVAMIMGSAASALAAVEVSGDVYAGVYDKYLWRGIDLSNGQPVLQSGVDVSAKGFSLAYWTNVQLSSGGADFLDGGEATETDIVLDYTFDATEMLAVSIGNIFYTFNVPGSTNELYLGLVFDTVLAPAINIYWDWDVANDVDADGLFYTASVGHTFPVQDQLGVNLGALVSYNQESPFVGDYSAFHNYELSVSADYAVTDQVSLSPSFLFSGIISDDAEDFGHEDEILVGASATFAF